jgi:hypothetical protein
VSGRGHGGTCIGCDQPIRPPFRSFAVSLNKAPDGNSITSWEDADVCDPCAAKLTVDDLYRLTTADEVAE